MRRLPALYIGHAARYFKNSKGNKLTALLIGPAEKAALQALRELAARNPIDMPALLRRITTGAGKQAHMRQMSAQTVSLPTDFAVTFSIQIGHPVGPCRHMSMSVNRPNRAPHPVGIWMVAQELGFVGAIELCALWPEELQGHGLAINLVQPVSAVAPGTS